MAATSNLLCRVRFGVIFYLFRNSFYFSLLFICRFSLLFIYLTDDDDDDDDTLPLRFRELATDSDERESAFQKTDGRIS